MKLRVGYTKGKKTKRKEVKEIFLEVRHGYNYSDLRSEIKKKDHIEGKIHISYVKKVNFRRNKTLARV